MKKVAIAASVLSLCLAGVAGAQAPERFFDLPKFTASPVIDGDRNSVSGEWDNALEFECSPSQILRDGAEWGWRDIEQQASEVSVNQLNTNGELEDASEGRSDADYSSMIWQAWDDEALYYILETRDNIHDVSGGGEARAWWERDSMSLYLDMNNGDHPGGDPTGEFVDLNVVNFMATPFGSDPNSVCLITTVQNARVDVHDADALEGFVYAYRDAGDEFGGSADYVIEGSLSWDAFLRAGNLNERPTPGSEMGFTWLGVDPDGEDAYGGQIQCVAWAGGNMSEFANWVFVDTPAGPAAGTAVEQDSWGRVKSTFISN
jgi:hypothetical protein